MAEDKENSAHATFALDRSSTSIGNIISPRMKSFSKAKESIFSPFDSPSSMKPKPFKILSDDEIVVASSKSVSAQSPGRGKPPRTAKRRSLATLQPSSLGKGLLSGQGRSGSIKDAFAKQKGVQGKAKNSVPATTTDVNQISTGKSDDDSTESLVSDAIKLMKNTEKVDDSYWRKIAEERRLALEETLAENEKLYDEIDALKAENEELKRKADEANYFKLMYTSLLETSEDIEQHDKTDHSVDS